MDTDTIIGLVVIAAALGAILILMLWSRRSINHIASNGYGTARKIVRERRRGR